MNITELHSKLIAAARSNPPSDRVPYAFEHRIMANLRGMKAGDICSIWAAALWRAAVPCVALAVLCSAWTFFAVHEAPSNDLAQDFDSIVMAEADQALN
jgi:hypothetical protein